MLFLLLSSLFIGFFLLSILHESIFFSIFFLIAFFLVTSFVFILLGFEFIGFLYLIVYVGAIAVLFLFMVMLFDKSEYLFFSNSAENKLFREERSILIFGSTGFSLILGFFLLILFENLNEVSFFDFSFFNEGVMKAPFVQEASYMESFMNLGTNLQRIGFLLYYYYFYSVIGAAVVLLVGMVGAITLTQTYFRGDSYKKHQEIKDQITRRKYA